MPRTAVVVGGSTGLGKALAKQLQLTNDSKGDMKVYATSRRLETVADLSAAGISAVKLDVTSDEEFRRGLQEIESQSGSIDLVICNAGIAATAPLLEEDINEVVNIFQTNTFGVLRCIQAVVPGMMKRRQGHVVVVGSITASLASPFNGAYAASKAALHSMTETLRMELQPFGVGVTEVWAGTFRTEINSKVASSLERYSLPSSAYQPIYQDIVDRASILEKEPNQMSPEQVAADIIKGILRNSPPMYIKTGTSVTMYNVLGYLQSFVCPGAIGSMLQHKFGLKKLGKIIAGNPAAHS